MKNLENLEYSEVKQDERAVEKPNLKGDRRNFAFLILLYVLQGVPQGISVAIPILLQNRGVSYNDQAEISISIFPFSSVPQGISVAIPILLQNRGVSYNDQAEFSISYFPFSLKLLYAPIVDSVYLKSFWRRKTWICGSQIFVGIFMIYTSLCVDEWMGIEGNKPQILMLTIFLHFMPRNQGLFTLSGFLMFWAIIYLLITILIAIFKSENVKHHKKLHETTDYGIKRAYSDLVDIIKLKPVIQLCTMIFTIETCFAACGAITSLKLIEYGVPKDKFALLTLPSAPVQILFPLLVAKYTTGKKPLSFYYKIFPCRVISMTLKTFYIFHTRKILESSLVSFYVGIIILYFFDHCFTKASYSADGCFITKIADPMIGGSYMTLINTFANVGNRIFSTFFLWLVDKITWKQCSSSANTFSVQNSTTINTCANDLEKEACIENGGNCETIVDGFYIEIGISVIIALIWYKFMKSVIFQLQRYPREDWFVLTKNRFYEMQQIEKNEENK
ncbi:hypothetical protein PVAND_011091 [Polypedilum vanderplanki]|uniref:Acetyl-coenzyme A transporter 1 n=1 Tax=Polypedilum vanderplanki TaxID=319348 RepID=A0A9J6CJD1_POLVA|nr:hypothetical protein PVAND_011091 [Polypedilum vanderplanki]